MRGKHVHLVGVAGTGMGALAGLLRQAGARVTGSDTAFYPPMGDKLREWGVETRQGFHADNLAGPPDAVIVGNVCRRDNPEARAAIDGGLAYHSMPGALETMFLQNRQNLVVAGTHGKTTTTALLAHLLADTGYEPGFLLGGVPLNFEESFSLGHEGGPFVIEGDEYDSAFFEKRPKFWRYRPFGAVVTAVEHDHIDIYPDEASYLSAFAGFIERLPPEGVLVAHGADRRVVELAARAPCPVVYYALEGEAARGVALRWRAKLAAPQAGDVSLELRVEDQPVRHLRSPLAGAHNARNTLAAMALAHHALGADIDALGAALARFSGVRRRQELKAKVDGVRVYDDFAHHPTAVRETLRALRARHPEGKLIAVFEPRSATASRNLHQALYPEAFASADVALLAPVGRAEIGAAERLDVAQVARDIETRLGTGRAEAPTDHEALLDRILSHAACGDTVVVMSNGDFKGLLPRLTDALRARERPQEKTP